jgi:UMP-CMP kinase
MIREMMVEGKLVPSEMTVKLLLKAMDDNTNDKFLVDGFPRNHDNRETFERMTDIIPEFILFLETTERRWKNEFSVGTRIEMMTI